jgi:hypothetical protein
MCLFDGLELAPDNLQGQLGVVGMAKFDDAESHLAGGPIKRRVSVWLTLGIIYMDQNRLDEALRRWQATPMIHATPAGAIIWCRRRTQGWIDCAGRTSQGR